MSITVEYHEILEAASQWPAERRAALAHDLLELPKKRSADRGRRPSFARALGLGRGTGEPPTDGKVRQWIDEHRMEKYGK